MHGVIKYGYDFARYFMGKRRKIAHSTVSSMMKGLKPNSFARAPIRVNAIYNFFKKIYTKS